MKFRRLQTFKNDFDQLPKNVQLIAKEKFALFKNNPVPPYHPSLRIKKMQGYEDMWEGHVSRGYVFTFTWEQD